jgi:hypothetical protein
VEAMTPESIRRRLKRYLISNRQPAGL